MVQKTGAECVTMHGIKFCQINVTVAALNPLVITRAKSKVICNDPMGGSVVCGQRWEPEHRAGGQCS